MADLDIRVRVVTASPHPETRFWTESYLGRSLSAMPEPLRPRLTATYENAGPHARGLSAVYNDALASAQPDEVLVFVHDDVYLHDWFIDRRIRDALVEYDVVGVVGASDSDRSQPSWLLSFSPQLEPLEWQSVGHRSGALNHFDFANADADYYGPAPRSCELLDGALLAVGVARCREAGVSFDERFAFHLYDLDFCRTAAAAGLTLGTWPISITHQSPGDFGSAEFAPAAHAYLEKWQAVKPQAVHRPSR